MTLTRAEQELVAIGASVGADANHALNTTSPRGQRWAWRIRP